MMWVSVVRIESEHDPGAELVTVLRERFGTSARTRTLAEWLYDAEQAAPPKVQSVRPLMDTRGRKLA